MSNTEDYEGEFDEYSYPSDENHLQSEERAVTLPDDTFKEADTKIQDEEQKAALSQKSDLCTYIQDDKEGGEDAFVNASAGAQED